MRLSLFATAAILLLQSPLAAVTIGQFQTFDDPNHQWVFGGGPGGVSTTPLTLELGGPGGPADPFLPIVSTGGTGPGSRLSAQNFGLWAGDYTGINGIRMDVRNFGTTDVSLRLLFVQFGAMGPVNAAVTTNAVEVLGGAGWQTVQFDISPAAMTAVIGSVSGALANTEEFRIFHSSGPTFEPGNIPAIAANVGLDNIAAVPEPSTAALLLCGLLFMVPRIRRG